MNHPLRDYQIATAAAMRDFALASPRPPEKRRVWSASTGSGKSHVLIAAALMIRSATGLPPSKVPILVPTPTILLDFLWKMGVTKEEYDGWKKKDREVIAYAKYGLVTLKVLKNRLLGVGTKGKGNEVWVEPAYVCVDEAHHSISETYQLLDLLSANTTVWMGVTATPFRGSAESTIKFRKAWGTPHVILTMKEAVERTPPVISFPTFRTVGLLDDEEISLRSGEFVESEAGEALSQFERLDKLADLIRGYHTFRCREGGTGAAVCPKFDRPTMVAMPTVLSAKALVAKLGEYASLVIGETSDPERDYAFRSCEGMVSVLVTVAVVGEGVDLPWLRRLIDARPTMSPVAFQQLVGRVMRPVGPSEAPPEVVSVCRNIYRHGYLFDGLLPKETVKQSVEAFDKPPSRHGGRWLGLESMGRLKKHEIPLADGLVGCYYCLESAEAHRKTEWVVLTTPARQQPLVFSREVEIKQNELGLREFVYGSARWKPDTMPDEWTGFSTGLKVGQEASPKQMEWWKRDAAKIGFDPEHKPTRRDFQVFVATLQANGRL